VRAQRAEQLLMLVCGLSGSTLEPDLELVEFRIAEPAQLRERVLVHLGQRPQASDLVQDTASPPAYPGGSRA
jgi:hypothetical protein